MSIANGSCQTPANGSCQTPSKKASRVGNSGTSPKQYHESCFVADEALGKLDCEHEILASGQLVTVCIATTRYVGTVNTHGFLVHAQQHIDQGTLAEKLLLTVRARISAMEVGGTFGDTLAVEVFLHKKPLGKLVGDYGNTGTTDSDWQDFELEVDVRDVKFPEDPCPGQGSDKPCGSEIVPASNEITFEFTGQNFPAYMEVDWLTLEPKDAPGLAWHPVLLVHGYNMNSAAWHRSAWAKGLTARDVAWHAVDVTPFGSITNNGAEITQAVDDLKKRFGVERVHVVGHSKGGLDARDHVKVHDDVETLIMLTTPNQGSFLADIGFPAGLGISSGGAALPLYYFGVVGLTTNAMMIYNLFYKPNDNTTYVAVSGAYDSIWAKLFATVFGENDEMVSVASVQALSYAVPRRYDTSVHDHEPRSICGNIWNHCCLRYYTQIVDDLFPVYIAALTPPLPAPRAPTIKTTLPPGVDTTPAGSRRGRTVARAAPGPVQGSAATGAQDVMSDGGIASDGVTFSHTAFINPSDVAIFLMFGQQEALHFELVSPSGSRIDATTPLADPTVTYASFGDAGFLPYTGYSIEGPEVGGWTLEVTGTSVSPPDGSVYAVAALVPLTPGTGVILTARVDQQLYAVRGTVTITATITEDGLPVTNAIVDAVVAHPDGTTTTQVALHDDGTNGDPAPGDGDYTGLFTTTTEAGLYAIVVSAARTAPAFTRKRCCWPLSRKAAPHSRARSRTTAPTPTVTASTISSSSMSR